MGHIPGLLKDHSVASLAHYAPSASPSLQNSARSPLVVETSFCALWQSPFKKVHGQLSLPVFGLRETHRCPLSTHTPVQASSHQPNLLAHHGCILQATLLHFEHSPAWVSRHMSHAQASCLLKALFTRLEVRNTISLAKRRDSIVFAEQISKDESGERLGAKAGCFPIRKGRMVLLSLFYRLADEVLEVK